MGCHKKLFGEDRNCKGVVTESAASQSKPTTEVVVADGRSGQGDDGLPEAGTSSCTPSRNENVVAAISESGTSTSRCMLAPMATLTASEIGTPDFEKKYTHVSGLFVTFCKRDCYFRFPYLTLSIWSFFFQRART